MEFKTFSSFEALASALADRVEADLGAALAAAGHASVAVPGGSTPAPFFDILSRRALAWDKVTVTLTDERWVPIESERSNERLVRARLLVHEAARAHFVSLKTEAASAREAESTVEARIAAMAMPLDVIIAGMGDDGHTFSWIPESDGLDRALEQTGPRVCAIVPPARSNLGERITLTVRMALEAKAIIVLARGQDKRHTYDAALAGDNVAQMPIRALIRQERVPAAFFWCPD